MTEEEAKTKWCPMVRNVREGINVGPWNRVEGEIPYTSKCIGSDCMLWRREVVFYTDEVGPTEEDNKRGYCGLAGEE